MNLKGLTYILLAVMATWGIAACSDENNARHDNNEGIEMAGISASMTRAVQVADLEDYVGKKEFDNGDSAVFVSIRRTESPIPQFTYSDVRFLCAASVSAEGVYSIGWSRDKNTGTTGSSTDMHPDRIYWSDATHPHTFIGYCAPQQGGGKKFDWAKHNNGANVAYYGSIGDPTVDPSERDSIDFRSTYDSEGHENTELRKNDILLTYSNNIKAEDAIAKLYFHHGLAQVRVIVNISDFAAGGGDDTLSTVSDMVLKDMLTMYKWRQVNDSTEEVTEADQDALNAIYGATNAPRYDQRKDFYLWIPQPEGIGEKSSRTFTFYGMTVPTTITESKPLQFSFKVTYPDPMKPREMKTHTYNAAIHDVRFDAGKCTTISISLNHKNEKMTVGAEYDDWEFVNVPDQGSLKKNSTFLDTTERDSVTIIGDAKANVDDATWLYIDETSKKIVDVYGNDGSATHPFQISTAYQLLSFAYEVKGGTLLKPRRETKYKDLNGIEQTLSGAFDFTGYTVSLDAGLTLQSSVRMTQRELLAKNPTIDQTSSEYTGAPALISWIGIGETEKPFNGNFNGGVRLISRLYGSPFFAELGPKAHVGQLILESVIDIMGDGGFANVNNGTICACKVDGNVTSEATAEPVGSFVGTNNGLVFACYHTGDLTARSSSAVGGLIGCNNEKGRIVASYNYGNITGPSGKTYGVLGQDNSTSGGTVIGCFYDKTKAKNVTQVAPSKALTDDYPSDGKTTVGIMKSDFAGTKESIDKNCLNGIINTWAESITPETDRNHFKSHYYVSQPAGYPYVY